MAARRTPLKASSAPKRERSASGAPGTCNEALVTGIRTRFASNGLATAAPAMQAYMKSKIPFHGINAPLRRRLTADAVRQHPCDSIDDLKATMESLFRGARFREEWYAAQELSRVGSHRKLDMLPLLPLYEEMIIKTAWWDCCDDISGNALPALLQKHPAKLKPVLRQWAQGDDMWLRRASILSQRRLKGNVDLKLFYECIEHSLDDARFNKEFFINKAIGWALRERSYIAPAEVIEYCEKNAHRLASLTKREALKVIARREKKQADQDDDEEDDEDSDS